MPRLEAHTVVVDLGIANVDVRVRNEHRVTARAHGVFRSDDDVAAEIANVRQQGEGAGAVPRAFVVECERRR